MRGSEIDETMDTWPTSEVTHGSVLDHHIERHAYIYVCASVFMFSRVKINKENKKVLPPS